MWVHCEKGEEAEGTAPGEEPRPWLHAEVLETLTELNEQCLQLLAEQAAVRSSQPHPLLRELAELWGGLDGGSRRRAAACPYLILDAGFADPRRWRSATGHEVHEREQAGFAAFFTVPGVTGVARQVYMYAWHLARTQSIAARVAYGMPRHCSTLIAGYSLRQIHELAERQSGWLRPRWAGRVNLWREFLLTATSGEGFALERARMHGLQLLAAELRTLPQG
jgi:hypothetical protein